MLIELVLCVAPAADPTPAAELFRGGVWGARRVELEGNVQIDSYDSRAGSYASQAVHGNGSWTYANSAGHVGSNGYIDLHQNADVHGHARCGPAAVTTVTGNATVSGSTAPGQHELVLAPIEVPPVVSAGPLSVPTGRTLTLSSGDHGFEDVSVGANATLRITGPARVVCRSLALASGSSLVVDAAAGPVELYVRASFALGPAVRVTSLGARPSDLRLRLLADTVLDADACVLADVYAPDAVVQLDGNFELFGRLMAERVQLDGWSRVHADEALAASR